jgi:hypothetical protein
MLAVDALTSAIGHVQNLLGIFFVLSATVNFQLNAKIEVAVRTVEDGFGLVVVVLDGSVALAVKALVAVRKVAALLIPGLVVGDECPALLAGGVAVIPASLTEYD